MDKNNRMPPMLTVPFMNQSAVTEAGEEFTLPDYYPEVRRVVSTLCRVLPESWYDSGDAVEQGGVVAFTVLYLGDDGSLTAAPLTTDFTATVQIPKGERGGAVISAETAAESVTCRATGPRRLALRSRLRTTVTGDHKVSAETNITDSAGDTATAAEHISVQTLDRAIPSMRRATGKLTGNVSGEMRERAGTKPVMCDGEIVVNEAVMTDTGILVRGDAVLWCICFGADGLYYKATARAPFEERISLDGEPLSGGSARAWGRCAAVSMKDSEDGTLAWEMEYDLECEAAENVEVALAADMYSTMWQSSAIPGEHESLSMLKCSTGRLSLSGTGKRSGSATPADYIIGSYGKATCERLDRTGGRLTLTGNAELKVLVCGGGEVTEETLRMPFKYETDCTPEGDGELMWRCDVSVVDSTARLEDDTIHATAELCLSLFAGLRCPTEYVARLELDRASGTEDHGGTVRIYYPAEGETAWDIAKKYMIPKNAVGEVAADGVLIE